MTEPTKGPLRIVYNGDHGGSVVVASDVSGEIASFIWGDPYYDAIDITLLEALANARLFAAARAMMEALELGASPMKACPTRYLLG